MARKNNAVAIVETAAAVVATLVETKVVYPTSEELIAAGMTTKSARIRHLHSLGMSIGDIARQETGGLYQHAYNVIKKPLKRPEATAAVEGEPETPAGDDDSDVGEDEAQTEA